MKGETARVFVQLVINPGSTSTKVAVFNDDEMVASRNLAHDAEMLAQFPSIFHQLELRYEHVMRFLEASGIRPSSLSAVMGRAGASALGVGRQLRGGRGAGVAASLIR